MERTSEGAPLPVRAGIRVKTRVWAEVDSDEAGSVGECWGAAVGAAVRL